MRENHRRIKIKIIIQIGWNNHYYDNKNNNENDQSNGSNTVNIIITIKLRIIRIARVITIIIRMRISAMTIGK